MKSPFLSVLVLLAVGLQAAAQSSQGSPTTNSQAGAAPPPSAQGSDISHKGKSEDKNAATTEATPAINEQTSSSASQAQAAGTTIQTELSKSLDSKKAKQGDQVIAKTTDDLSGVGSLVIPRGSKLIGHVVEARAHDKNQPEGRIVLVFDRAVLRDGHEVPIRAAILAIAAPVQSTIAPDMVPSAASPIGSDQTGGVAGGATYPGGVSSGAQQYPSATGANTPDGGSGTSPGAAAPAGARLTADSRGVIGIRGVQLKSSADPGQGSVLSSSSSNVHLDSGTRILVRLSAE